MNFALIASLLWLFASPDKEKEADAPLDQLINGAVYIIQNEADSSVLDAWEAGVPGYRPGYVNSTEFRLDYSTTWSIQYFRDNRFFTLRSQSEDHTHNELALLVEKSPDGKRPDTYNRYWNLTFVTRTFGFDRWQIIDFGKGAENNNGTEKCLQNHEKESRIEVADCNKKNRRQRWRFCLCSLPPLPKGHTERERVIERIH